MLGFSPISALPICGSSGTAYLEVIGDNLDFSDESDAARNRNRAASNALALTVSATVAIEYSRSLTDNLNLSSSANETSLSTSSTLDLQDLAVAQKITGITTAYGTMIEADAYFRKRLYSDLWSATNLTERKASLIQATRIIDRLNFLGDKASTEQELEFPRLGDSVTPDDIKIASFEIAYALIDGFDLEMETEDLAVVSEGFSSVRATYDRTIVQPHLAAGVPSMTAWRYLLPYLRDDKTFKLCRVN